MSSSLPPDGIPADKWLVSKLGGGGDAAYQIFYGEFKALANKTQADPPPPLADLETGKDFDIQARLVQGHKGARTYIACRGPTAETAPQFYTMVHQQGVVSICQFNGLEAGSPVDLTTDYAPPNVGDQRQYGPWTVKCLWSGMKEDADDVAKQSGAQSCTYRLSRLELTRPGADTRQLTHMCHMKWPDGCLPVAKESVDSLLRLSDILRKDMKKMPGPIVVHCMGGMGRTGTAILLDICASRLLSESTIEVEHTLLILRDQRPQAVRTRYQYLYVNLAVAQLALARLTKKQLPSVFGSPEKEKGIRAAVEECWKMLLKTLPKH